MSRLIFLCKMCGVHHLFVESGCAVTEFTVTEEIFYCCSCCDTFKVCLWEERIVADCHGLR